MTKRVVELVDDIKRNESWVTVWGISVVVLVLYLGLLFWSSNSVISRTNDQVKERLGIAMEANSHFTEGSIIGLESTIVQ